jgi:hypothetical protein
MYLRHFIKIYLRKKAIIAGIEPALLGFQVEDLTNYTMRAHAPARRIRVFISLSCIYGFWTLSTATMTFAWSPVKKQE